MDLRNPAVTVTTMPSKESQHLAFFFVLLVSIGLHRYVFLHLRHILRPDFPQIAPLLVRIALILFIAMDLPFVFIYFRGQLHGELTLVTRDLLYPFSVWQALLFMWAVILMPFSLWRRRDRLGMGWIRARIASLRKQKDAEPQELLGEEAILAEGEIALEGAAE